MCERRKLKVNARKSKVIEIERFDLNVIDFVGLFNGSVKRPMTECKMTLNNETVEEVRKVRY